VRGETGPSGGPAMTDLLGTCLAWDADGCLVAPDAGGDPVRIALADVVSGKPVPPRPSPRLRISAPEAQRRAMTLFPALETAPLGAWTLRRSTEHAARRANSVLAMADPGLPDDAAYDGVVGFYRERGARPVAAVLPGSAPEALFLDRGWGPESADADTVFELASVASVTRRMTAPSVPASVRVEGDLATATVLVDGVEAASGVAALDGDWVGYRSIAVDPAYRRRGLGLAVMGALVELSAERGASTAYLQVLGDNVAALALYERLGFVEHHRYRYLAEPV
jgi:N-acetylglutamate synthase